MAKPELIIKLLQPIFDGGQRLEALTFAAETASLPVPVSINGHRREIDTVAMLHVIASGAGISLSAVAKLSAADLMTITTALFAPVRRK